MPLFAPADEAEIAVMIKVMARKNKTSLAEDAMPEDLAGHGYQRRRHREHRLSAKRIALTQAREAITRDDLDRAFKDFIPSAQGLEKEKQELAAVLECTSMSFLPEGLAIASRLARRPRQASRANGRDPATDRRMNVERTTDQSHARPHP